MLALLDWPRAQALSGPERSAAMCLELLHRASIIVDDIVDRDVERRGQPTLHVRLGIQRTVVVGHLLCSLALREAQRLPDVLKIEILDAYCGMAVGELADIDRLGWLSEPLQTYECLVLQKTEALFRATFVAAAVLPSRAAVSVAMARDIGVAFGRVYQLANDHFDDLLAPEGARGGNRLTSLNLSLPTAQLLDLNPAWRARLADCEGDLEPALLRLLVSDRSAGPIAAASEAAVATARARLSALTFTGPAPWRGTLSEVGSWISSDGCWDHSDHCGGAYVGQ